MRSTMIEIRDVTKKYRRCPKGGQWALQGLSLTVRRGECVGLIGPNGAGKSTVLDLLAGFVSADGGSAHVDGRPPQRYARERGVSYLSGSAALPPDLRVRDLLHRLAVLDGLSRRSARTRAEGVTRRTGLADRRAARVGTLSRGLSQRLRLAALLLRPRDLVLMDEPTSGLDPLWRGRFRRLLGELRAARPETTFLIASHELDEIRRVADRIVLLADGRAREEFRCAPGAGGPTAGLASLRSRVERSLARAGGVSDREPVRS